MQKTTRTPEYFVEQLTGFLRTASAEWMKVAECLHQAQQALKHAELEAVCRQVGIKYPTAVKLINIHKSSRLKSYATQLSPTVSWGTLYEITKLKDAEFAQFRDKHLTGEKARPITRKEVEFYRSASRATRQRVRLFSTDLDTSIPLSVTERARLNEVVEQLRQIAKDKLFTTISEKGEQVLLPVSPKDSKKAA